MRVVGTLTTLPTRYDKLIRTLDTLRKQDRPVDKLYLTVPAKTARSNLEYPEFPKEVTDLCTIVNIGKDFGPVTKIIGALLRESDPDTIIITFDDDIIYSNSVVSSLLEAHQRWPHKAIGSSGGLIKGRAMFYSANHNCTNSWDHTTSFKIPKNGFRKVDVICGFSGALYKREFFPDKNNLIKGFLEYTSNKDVMCNDDLLISAYLEKQMITRIVVDSVPKANENKNHKDKRSGDELSSNKVTFLFRLIRAIENLRFHGFFKYHEERNFRETTAYRMLWWIMFTLFIILCARVLLL